ncbi:hypothetical protein BK022_03385 [Methylorubrum extorquens]|uniref:Uncharacterized protein n=1 Tax=Methylorubrum extorquens TaxID=408 RepID=A0A1S1P4A8_METEX|nr:hypothetical protein BK022_03385 [Methylorubrum extorquens]
MFDRLEAARVPVGAGVGPTLILASGTAPECTFVAALVALVALVRRLVLAIGAADVNLMSTLATRWSMT